MQVWSSNPPEKRVWKVGVIREAERKPLKVVSVEMLGSYPQKSQLLTPCADSAALSGTSGLLFKFYLTLEF